MGSNFLLKMVSKITDKILPEVKEWQSRPLNPVYPFVFMDCIHYKVREDGRILSPCCLYCTGSYRVQIASQNGHLCHIRRPLCDLNGGQPGTH